MRQQEVRGNVGGSVVGGNVHITTHHHNAPCPGPSACPFERSEEERQKRFESQTGISCSRGAREALQHLLETGVFDYRQLAISWRYRSLWWDWDAVQLKTNISQVETVYGFALVAMGIVMIAGAATAVILNGGSMPGYEWGMAGAAMPAGVIAALTADRTMIRPNRIAKRVEPYLRQYYERSSNSPSRCESEISVSRC